MPRRTTYAVAVVVAAVAAIAATAQPLRSTSSHARPDRYVTIQLRNDFLGLRTNTLLPAEDDMTASRASITGKLLSFGDEFISLEVQTEEVWVRREAVLLIHFLNR